MKKPITILFLGLSLAVGGLGSCKEKAATTATSPATAANPAGADTTATATKVVTVADSTSTPAPATTTPPPATASKSQKFGYINSAELLKIMPEAKKADANLNAFVRNLETQFGSLQTDYQKKITEFQAQEKTMVDAVKQTRIKAITDLEQQMQQSQASAQQQIAQKRETLFKPILDKAERAIKAVGKENNYDYIFDTSSGSFIYANEGHNVMPLVKAKLKIK